MMSFRRRGRECVNHGIYQRLYFNPIAAQTQNIRVFIVYFVSTCVESREIYDKKSYICVEPVALPVLLGTYRCTLNLVCVGSIHHSSVSNAWQSCKR